MTTKNLISRHAMRQVVAIGTLLASTTLTQADSRVAVLADHYTQESAERIAQEFAEVFGSLRAGDSFVGLSADGAEGVDLGRGRNRIISFPAHRLCHLYSPVIRICAHPRGEMCGRSSIGQSNPARFRCATVLPSRSVFQ
jgi:hypothetical protein